MIGANQQLKIYTSTAGERDAEGRKAMTFELTDTVLGNLFERVSNEIVNGSWTVVSEHLALLPAGVTISHKDVIEDADGDRYRVETVAARRGPDGQIHHISCNVRRTEA